MNRGAAQIVIVLLAFGVASALAATGKKLKAVEESTTLGPGDQGSVGPRCPGKKTAVSGGFEGGVDLTAGDLTQPIDSLRDRNRKVWRSVGSGFILAGSSGDFTGFAYCRKQKVRTKANRRKLPPVGGAGAIPVRTVIARCKRDATIVSGGFASPHLSLGLASSLALAHESRKVGKRRWRVTGGSYGSEPTTLLAQANCQNARPVTTRRARRTLVPGAPAVAVADIVAKCRRNERVVSGGFRGPTVVEPGVPPRFSWVSASRKAGPRRWSVSALTANEPASFTAFAYCEKRRTR